MADFILLDEGRLRPASGTRIIKKDTYAIFGQAEDILTAARTKAADILAAAEKVYQSEKLRGHAEGLEKARTEMAEEMAAAALRTEQHFRTLEEETVSLVMAVVRKVLHAIEPRALVVAQVSKALEAFKGSPRVTLKVHPQVADDLHARLSEITAKRPDIDLIDVKSAPDLDPDRLILQSATGILEATMETQLEAIEQGFRQVIDLPN
jgi:type III secretion system HrpE/YscL family protein